MSRTCHKHQWLFEETKPATIQRFGKNVSQLVISGNEGERVLGPRVLNRILGDIYSTCIITMDNHCILRESIVT
jgi:hypothetical protein